MSNFMEEKDILIVEDNLELVELLKAFYSLFPHSYEVIHSSEAALEIIKRRKFKIYVLDINLGSGKMHGVDLAVIIRKQSKEVKIYALTGYLELFNNISPRVAGFDKVYYKPVDYKKLLTQIDTDLRKK